MGKEVIKINKVFTSVVDSISVSISAQIGFAAPTSTGSQTGLAISVEPSYLSVAQEDMFAASNFETK